MEAAVCASPRQQQRDETSSTVTRQLLSSEVTRLILNRGVLHVADSALEEGLVSDL